MTRAYGSSGPQLPPCCQLPVVTAHFPHVLFHLHVHTAALLVRSTTQYKNPRGNSHPDDPIAEVLTAGGRLIFADWPTHLPAFESKVQFPLVPTSRLY